MTAQQPEDQPLNSSVIRDRFLYQRPPSATPFVEPELIREYRKDAAPSHDPERNKALRIEAGTFLQDLHRRTPRDVEGVDSKAIAQGFGLERTPYDAEKGAALDLWQDPSYRDLIKSLYTQQLQYMELQTHPSLLEARLAMQNSIEHAGNSELRPKRTIEIFEQKIAQKIAITWENVGWGIPERLYDSAEAEDESTTAIRAQGTYSHICNSPDGPIVALPIVAPSHPDLMGSLVQAEHALVGGLTFVPCDALFSDNKTGLRWQKESLKATYEILRSHPLLVTHRHGNRVLSNGQSVRQHLFLEARKRIGVTLKPHPVENSAERAKELYETYGVTLFRVFDPRDTKSLPQTIEAVRKATNDKATIIGSQVTGVESARACYNAGAQAIVMNIGEGGHCSTSSGTHQIPSNFLTFYRIQRDGPADLGIILDGGVGKGWVLGLALGASAAMKHGSLIGSTIQQAPCFIALKGSDGLLYKLQSGEAAKRNKYRSGNQFDVASNLKNVEGVDRAFQIFNGLSATVAERLDVDFLAPCAKQLAFCGATHLHQFMQWQEPVLWEPTSETRIKAAPHA
ncbi:MAG: IMP dehydrogenase, partial [Bdellovibrionales bacterium]|nr:IMP dehydrogenase [Bdellovibrionales bacterium]